LARVDRMTLRDRKFADSSLEGDGFELVWGFFCQESYWSIGGFLFGAGKPFFVRSPATRFAERAEWIKGRRPAGPLLARHAVSGDLSYPPARAYPVSMMIPPCFIRPRRSSGTSAS